MPITDELQDHITVNVNVPSVNIPSHPLFAPVVEDIQRKVSNLERLKPIVGSRVANRAKLNQMQSIKALDAICSGALYNSIRVQGGGNEYRVGTNSSKNGYWYLINGRNAIDLTGEPRIMIFQHKCGGRWVKAKRVREAAPKNYMEHSRPNTERDIKQIVEEEVSHAMA